MGSRIPKKRRDQAVCLVKEGRLTLVEISEKVGVAVGSISSWAREAGVTVKRSAGRPVHKHPSPDVIHMLETFYEVMREGVGPRRLYTETAKRLGVLRQQVWSTVKKWEERGWLKNVEDGPYYAAGKTIRWKDENYVIIRVLSHHYAEVKHLKTGEIVKLFRFDAGGCFAEVVDK